jgi:hypothetical protein
MLVILTVSSERFPYTIVERVLSHLIQGQRSTLLTVGVSSGRHSRVPALFRPSQFNRAHEGAPACWDYRSKSNSLSANVCAALGDNKNSFHKQQSCSFSLAMCVIEISRDPTHPWSSA